MMDSINREDNESLNAEVEYLTNTFIVVLESSIQKSENLVNEFIGIEDGYKNIWFTPIDAITLRQQLAPNAKQVLNESKRIRGKIKSVVAVVEQYAQGKVDAPDVLAELKIEISSREGQFTTSATENGFEFSMEQLEMSKKEAQRTLTPEQFKRWKKEERRMRSRSADDE
jgi:hypothetical protein